METDDNDVIIVPRRGRNEAPLPVRGMLVVNPTEAVAAFQAFRSMGAKSRPFHHATLMVDVEEKLCLAGPALGAPAAGLVMEKMIALGVRRFLLFSCCGSINEEISIGDVLVAAAGVCGEGVSQYYGGGGMVQADKDGSEELRRFLDHSGYTAQRATIWSTDAPYRERRSELAALRADHGVAGVDMEFTALCSIASFRKVALSALFVVSDELFGRSWKPGFSRTLFKKRCSDIIKQLLEWQLGCV